MPSVIGIPPAQRDRGRIKKRLAHLFVYAINTFNEINADCSVAAGFSSRLPVDEAPTESTATLGSSRTRRVLYLCEVFPSWVLVGTWQKTRRAFSVRFIRWESSADAVAEGEDLRIQVWALP